MQKMVSVKLLSEDGNYSKTPIGVIFFGIFAFAVFIWLTVLTVNHVNIKDEPNKEGIK